MRTLLLMTVALMLSVCAPAVAQEETTGPDCGPGSAGAAGGQYGDEPCVDSPAAAPEAAKDAARDAAEDAGGHEEGAAAFERAMGTADLARKHGMTELPETGGPPLLALVAGSMLLASSLALRGRVLRH